MRAAFDFRKRGPAKDLPGPRSLPDRAMLDILDRVEAQGMTNEMAGARYGMSRSAVASMVMRVRKDLADSEAAPGPKAKRPENQDGALGRRWWERLG